MKWWYNSTWSLSLSDKLMYSPNTIVFIMEIMIHRPLLVPHPSPSPAPTAGHRAPEDRISLSMWLWFSAFTTKLRSFAWAKSLCSSKELLATYHRFFRRRKARFHGKHLECFMGTFCGSWPFRGEILQSWTDPVWIVPLKTLTIHFHHKWYMLESVLLTRYGGFPNGGTAKSSILDWHFPLWFTSILGPHLLGTRPMLTYKN